MTITIGKPAANYAFNAIQDIRSHSSALFNERLAILFYLLDMRSIKLNTLHRVDDIVEVKSTLLQIYKNVRMLIRNNPTMRATLNLETKDEGIYVTDVAFDTVEKMIRYCDANGYTMRRIYIIVQELNNVEIMVRDALQYFNYFMRPDFRQKPDIELATEKYKEIADKKTIEELKSIVGLRHKIDFEGLGSRRVEFGPEIVEKSEDAETEVEEDEPRE